MRYNKVLYLLLLSFMIVTAINATQVNLASGKSYSFNLQPNYPLCTDAGDSTQLTDGSICDPLVLWGQTATVGWRWNSAPVEITVDLEQVEPVCGVSFHTAASEPSGVYWPLSIQVLVSLDNTTFYYAGELWELNGRGPAAASSYQSYTFQTEKMATKARYVKFRITAPEPHRYIFCDEIQIFKGDDELLKLEKIGESSSFLNVLNLASGCSYSFNLPPNYSYCTETGDSTQLTDEDVYLGDQSLWLRTSTVGWQSYSYPIEINMDIGSVAAIRGLSMRTAAGVGAGVLWPEKIDLLISDDGIDYYYLGDLTELAVNSPPEPDDYYVFTYLTSSLITKGRYIKFIVHPAGDFKFFFCDEIKVFLGPNDYLSLNQPGKDIEPALSNLALNKTYLLYPSPNYSLCTETGDSTQLTDGFAYTGTSSLWTQTSTVGWGYVSTPKYITVDLGTVKSISGAALHMGAGTAAGVAWPHSVDLHVSLDGTTYYYAGDLLADSFELPGSEGQTETHWYKNYALETKARYFRFIVHQTGTYAFLDELEIYSGPASNLNLQVIGEDLSVIAAMDQNQRQIELSSKIRFRYDLNELEGRVHFSEIPASVKVAVKNSIADYRGQVSSWTFQGDSATFRAVPPFNTLHENIIKLNGSILQGKGFADCVVWKNHRFDNLETLQEPDTATSVSLNLRMMKHEIRSDVLNFTNTSANSMNITFSLQNLSGGNNPSYAKVYEVEYADTREGIVRGAALLPLTVVDGSYEITVPAGMTRQIWISIDSATLSSGQYSGSVVATIGGTPQTIPLNLNISTLTLASGGLDKMLFDYVTCRKFGINYTNQAQAVALLDEYAINNVCGQRNEAAMPTPEIVDANGNLTGSLDFSSFDSMVTRFPNADRYYIFLVVNDTTPGYDCLGGKEPGTAAFNNLMQQWCAAWDAHLQSKGIPAGKVMFNILDEPTTAVKYELLNTWAQGIHQNSTRLGIFCDPAYVNLFPTEFDELLTYADVVCSGRQMFENYDSTTRQKFLNFGAQSGKEFWFYMCIGPSRHFDPSYFRMQAWHAFDLGATGSCFWSFSDSGGVSSAWNDYAVEGNARSAYSMIYFDETTVDTSKQMEAYREGAQDYDYLQMLKAVNASLAAVMASDTVSLVRSVASYYYHTKWSKSDANYEIDQVRLQILDELE